MPDDQVQGMPSQYRTLQDKETRLRAIRSELASLAQTQNPSEEDENYQGRLGIAGALARRPLAGRVHRAGAHLGPVAGGHHQDGDR